MRYTFQSLQQHNFRSIFKKSLYHLLWPLGFLIAIQLFFPKTDFAKEHYHVYLFIATELFHLFSISRDAINEITIDNAKKIFQISYYNVYEGQREEKFPFSEIKVDINENRKKEVRHIIFFIKRKTDFILTKKNDNFSQQDLESLKEVIYAITSPAKS